MTYMNLIMMRTRRGLIGLAAVFIVGIYLSATTAIANGGTNFVGFIAAEADKPKGNFNTIGNVVLALAQNGYFTNYDLTALTTADITAFLPTDFAFRRLVADLKGVSVWKVQESEVIPFLAGALGLDAIANVVKYHIFAGGRVDYKTALSLDSNRGAGTNVSVPMYNGGSLGIDRRVIFLQLKDNGGNNPWVIGANINAGNALVHAIDKVLLP